jgi:ribosomal protein L37AE/L43A
MPDEATISVTCESCGQESSLSLDKTTIWECPACSAKNRYVSGEEAFAENATDFAVAEGTLTEEAQVGTTGVRVSDSAEASSTGG